MNQMRRELKYNWLLTFPGNWKTKEGYILSTIDRPAKRGFGWYRFKHHEFEVQGSFQAQLKAEELIESDLEMFERALDNVQYL